MPPKRKQEVDKLEKPWEAIAQEAQAHRDESVAKVHSPKLPNGEVPSRTIDIPAQVLAPDDLHVTELPPENLLRELACGKLTAVRVTEVFLRRAGLAQQLTNCITELLPERALARAAELDAYFAEHAKAIGPMHGLPISVKESIGMKGLGLNAGFVAWYDHKAEVDAHVLQILARAGAVFHARSTQPQTMMHLETDSNLYGVTVSPYDSRLSAGGSSGGEGALIALKGSILGIGSDVGGSIRSPAANNGVYGLKPTAFRLPTDGWASIMAGVDFIPCVIGPLSTSLAGIELFMKTVLDAKPWIAEPALVPIPWNGDLRWSSARPLKLAIMWDDNVVRPHPPIIRAMRTLKQKLESITNVSVVDWKPHLHDEAWAITSRLYYPDGAGEEAAVLTESGEPWRPLTTWLLKETPGVKKLNMKELGYWLEEREHYRKEYAEAWNGTATGRDPVSGEPIGMVDAVISPVGPGVAPKHDTARYWAYTSQWNLLDYPALAFPVSRVDAKLDSADKSYTPLNDLDKENWTLYDPELFHGLPVSLQLVGRRFDDEKLVAILKHLQKQTDIPVSN